MVFTIEMAATIVTHVSLVADPESPSSIDIFHTAVVIHEQVEKLPAMPDEDYGLALLSTVASVVPRAAE